MDPPEWQLLETLAPHLKRAAAVHQLLVQERAAEESLAAAVAAAGFAVFLLTKDCRVIFANAKAEDLVRRGAGFVITDPSRALISGKCADIGKVKGPILRGLAARAPYFHNSSAATLFDTVNFSDPRFSIGFTDQQKEDLVNFLETL